MKPKMHTTDFLENYLSEISDFDKKETTSRMKLTAAIEDAMRTRDISTYKLAEITGQKNSVISKCLSGTQNVSTDTLKQISMCWVFLSK